MRFLRDFRCNPLRDLRAISNPKGCGQPLAAQPERMANGNSLP
jgi:hypothetical protein